MVVPFTEEEKSDTSVSEILSTSSVFITPNNSPDKDEKKTAASDEDRNKDIEPPKEAGCKKVCDSCQKLKLYMEGKDPLTGKKKLQKLQYLPLNFKSHQLFSIEIIVNFGSLC